MRPLHLFVAKEVDFSYNEIMHDSKSEQDKQNQSAKPFLKYFS